MEFRLLGMVEVVVDGRTVRLGGNRSRAVLATLLLRANRTVSVDQLARGVWPVPPLSAEANIRTYVANLRSVLVAAGESQPRLVRDTNGYRVVVYPGELDLASFDELVAEAEQAAGQDLARVESALRQAMELWRGEPLAGLELGPLLEVEAVRLQQRQLAVVERWAEAALAIGGHTEVAAALAGWVRAHPLREQLRAMLLVALYRGGRQGEALESYREVVAILDEELGVPPGPALRTLHQQILAGDPELDSPQPASNRTPNPRQLPANITHFTGREEQLNELEKITAGPASTGGLVAIAGTAGVGKTALALYWAHHVADRFPDGQLYANLRGYDPGQPVQPADVLDGFLRAYGILSTEIPPNLDDRAALYRSILNNRRTLVILDNAASAEQVRPLLPGTPTCQTVVTSRSDLTGLAIRDGAHLLTLHGLTETESLELLGRILGHDHIAEQQPAATNLIHLCVGLPLAIRILAERATRRPDTPLATLANELTALADEPTNQIHNLDAFEVPGDPTTAVRQVFSWSYRALAEPAARLFRLLGLHPGPEPGAAAAACLSGGDEATASRLLRHLAGVHLVELGSGDRCHLHDLLRAYAAELAYAEETEAERAAALGRLLDWYMSNVDAASRMLYPNVLRLPPAHAGSAASAAAPEFDDPAAALAWLETERVNLLAAVEHTAKAGPHPMAWHIFDGMRGYLSRQHPDCLLRAGVAAHSAALAAGDTQALALTCLGIGVAHANQGDPDEAIECFANAVQYADRAGWLHGQCAALINLGTAYLFVGRLDEAAECLERAVVLDQDGQYRSGVAALPALGYVHMLRGRLAEATACYARALESSERSGSVHGVAQGLYDLGEVDGYQGRFDSAIERYTSALRLLAEIGDRVTEARVYNDRAAAQRDAGRYGEAMDDSDTALRLQSSHGDRWQRVDTVVTRGTIHCAAGRSAEAIADLTDGLAAAHETARTSSEVRALIGLATAHRQRGRLAQARRYAEEALALIRRFGYRLYEGQALTEMAAIDDRAGDPQQASRHAEQALAIHQATGNRLGHVRTLLLLGRGAARTGDTDAARSHWRNALELCAPMGSDLPEAGEAATLLSSL